MATGTNAVVNCHPWECSLLGGGAVASLGVDSNPMSATAGTSIDSDLDHLHQQGYVVVPSLLTREQIDRIKAELAPYLRGTLRGRNDFEGFDTERVYALLAKAPVIAELVEHPRILPILDRWAKLIPEVKS